MGQKVCIQNTLDQISPKFCQKTWCKIPSLWYRLDHFKNEVIFAMRKASAELAHIEESFDIDAVTPQQREFWRSPFYSGSAYNLLSPSSHNGGQDKAGEFVARVALQRWRGRNAEVDGGGDDKKVSYLLLLWVTHQVCAGKQNEFWERTQTKSQAQTQISVCVCDTRN